MAYKNDSTLICFLFMSINFFLDRVPLGFLIQSGKKNRSVGATLMNQESSRSHSIFTVTVETSAREMSTESLDSNLHIHVGKLNLVCIMFH